MPVEINLVPRAKAKGERRGISIPISTFNVVLVLLVLALGYLIFPFASFSEDNAIHDLPNLYGLYDEHQDAIDGWEDLLESKEAERDDLMSLSGQALTLQEQIDELEDLLDDITLSYQALAASTVVWSQVLEEINDAAPAGVTITSVSHGSDLEIQGLAEDTGDIIDFRTALLDTQLFFAVVISEMTCQPVPTPTPTPTPTPPCTFTITAILFGGIL